LGIGRGIVCIKEVFDGDYTLPYFNGDCDTIQKALNSFVIWDLKNLEKYILDSNKIGISCVENTCRDIIRVKDYTLRSNWMLEDVELYFEGRIIMVARGVITIP
jgi:hypothetical protein